MNLVKYEAYLYQYTHIPTSRIYLGIHKGLIEDAYTHSSTCEEFQSLLRDNPEDFNYAVLMTGSYNAMRNKEHEMLQAVNAKSNPKYFNKSNGSPANRPFNEEGVMRVFDYIQNAQGEQVLATELLKMNFLQVRADTDFTHVHDMKSAIDEENGNTEKLGMKSVSLAEYYDETDDEYGSDGSLGIGGRHSTEATAASKFGKTLEHISVPFSVWDGCDEAEIQEVGLLLNRQEGKVKPKENQTDDFVKYAMTLIETKNIDPDSDEMYQRFSNFNVPKRVIDRAIKKAKRLIKESELKLVGKTVCDWTRGPLKKRLDEVIIPNMLDGETYVEVITSGSYGSLLTMQSNFVEALSEGKKFTKVRCIVRHPTITDYENWGKRPKEIKAREAVEHFMKMSGYDYQETGLKFLQEEKAQIIIS